MHATTLSGTFFFSSAVEKNIKIFIYRTNFPCGSVWISNLVSDFKGGTQTEGIENRLLRRIFGPNRDETTAGWRFPKEELQNFYPLPSIIRVIMNFRDMGLSGMDMSNVAQERSLSVEDSCGHSNEPLVSIRGNSAGDIHVVSSHGWVSCMQLVDVFLYVDVRFS
jgi:hypothetical protein